MMLTTCTCVVVSQSLRSVSPLLTNISHDNTMRGVLNHCSITLSMSCNGIVSVGGMALSECQAAEFVVGGGRCGDGWVFLSWILADFSRVDAESRPKESCCQTLKSILLVFFFK